MRSTMASYCSGRVGAVHALERGRAAGLQRQVQERGDALPARDHGVDEAVVDVHGLKRRQPHLGNVRLLEDDVEQLVDLDVRVGRIDAVVGAEVHAGEDDLGDAGALGAANLFEHGGNRHGTLRPARLPHDAVRAAVVASCPAP